MNIHLVTVGKPRLAYARLGWQEYCGRLSRYHHVRATHLADKYADDTAKLRHTAREAHIVALVVAGGQQFSSKQLASYLEGQALRGGSLCFMIGGPQGLPDALTAQADLRWSFGPLTYPHDLAMVMLAESLYRASTISAGHPYHRT